MIFQALILNVSKGNEIYIEFPPLWKHSFSGISYVRLSSFLCCDFVCLFVFCCFLEGYVLFFVFLFVLSVFCVLCTNATIPLSALLRFTASDFCTLCLWIVYSILSFISNVYLRRYMELS